MAQMKMSNSRHNLSAFLYGGVSAIALTGMTMAGAIAQEQDDGLFMIDEIIVTARKRSESMQDVPMSIQAFGTDAIERMGLRNFEDTINQVPGLSFVTQGPGQSTLAFRGVATEPATWYSQNATTAVYLDEQPITSGGHNPDPRLVDIERVEALSGPQGTLYGSSSQAGTLKIVTNKPDPSEFTGYAEAGVSKMAHGEWGYDFNGMLNIPLIEDKLAIRLVGFSALEGGFIDNVPGLSPGAYDGDNSTFGTYPNTDAVKDDMNPVRTSGGRIALRWNASEDWSATAGFIYQDTHVSGFSDYDPTIGDLQVVRFYDEERNDKWYQGSLTIEGDLGFASIVSATSYMDRDASYFSDNTSYIINTDIFGAYADYAEEQFWLDLGYNAGDAAYYADYYSDYAFYAFYEFGDDPVSWRTNFHKSDRITQEVRLSSNSESRLSWVAGLFYTKSTFNDKWKAHIRNYQDTESWALGVAYAADQGITLDPSITAYWYEDTYKESREFAVFGEATFEFTDRLSATVGGRWFKAKTAFWQDVWIPDTLYQEAASVGKDPGTDSGWTPKLNLKYNIGEDSMVYATYSKGFRLGGTNALKQGSTLERIYNEDTIINYEVGYKSTMFDRRLVLNVTGYYMQWLDMQTDIVDPSISVWAIATINGGDARIYGLEASFSAKPTQNLDISGSFAYIDARTQDAFRAGNAVASDQFVPAMTRLPITAEVKGSFSVQYSWDTDIGGAYVRGDYSYNGHSWNSMLINQRGKQPAYDGLNIRAGLETETWDLAIFVNNVWDERAWLYNNNFYYSERQNGGMRVTPGRPREMGMSLRYKF